ncbi:DUF6924 domain-containing protein [Streptomyces sp. NPDC059215]|uniref:DUF6924 domain-containing protein n=1 Tax=Streptomyces sp. NPDC059215 TaxID=3346772 RepID=UPI0036A986E9
MNALPTVVGRDEFDALVVRTDYHDDVSWRAVTTALAEPWAPGGDGQYTAGLHLVDDPAWAEAGVDDVVAAVRADENLPVVFLADGTTMRAAHHALLAVTTLTREECEDDEDHRRLVEYGRAFRTVPAGVHDIHANLSIGNLGFEEYAAMAHDEPEGVYRVP